MGEFSVIEYLNDPQLVARFQRKFGVCPPLLPSKSGPSSSTSGSSSIDSTTSSRKSLSSRSISKKISVVSSIKGEGVSLKTSSRGTDLDYEFDLRKSSSTVEDSIGQNAGGDGDGDYLLRSRLSHARTESSGSSESSGVGSGGDEDEDDRAGVMKYVTNKYWYYLFQFGTALGDEVFYACWFSFWFWNVDGAVGRRVVLLWAILMYIGQGLKDIIRWPRPSCPPVIRLEKKWEKEYGMPSTHAVVGAAVPFATIIFTASRYQYPIEVGVVVALGWCTLVCMSRLYLGMHSVLDIVAGLSLVGLLFIPVIPLVDWLDPVILNSKYGGFGIFLAGIVLCCLTPGGDRWTPARGDTFVILGSCVGLTMGAWLNYQLGIISGPPLDPPYAVIWPSYSMLGLSLLRLIIGLCIIVATRAIMKSFLDAASRAVLNVPKVEDIDLSTATKKEVFAELSQKFLRYVAMGISTVYLSPVVFRLIGIERPTFHTEV